MRALFLHSNVDDARQRRVARQFGRAGWDIVRCGFRRDYYRRDAIEFEAEILGSLAHSAIASRGPAVLRALQRLRSLAEGCSVAYCFGADMHVAERIATAGRRMAVIRDVADLPAVLSANGARSRVARLMDDWSARNCDGLVVTSRAFYDDYYEPRIRSSAPRCFTLENSIDPADTGPRIPAPDLSNDRPIRIGYFGLLRCRRSLEILSEAARRNPHGISVMVRGYTLLDEASLAIPVGLPNFEFGGPYRSPEDLASLYGNCDVVWSCYPYAPLNLNSRLARTNRFYEACYFRRPQIAQVGTKDAEKVIELGIGLALDLSEVAKAASRLAEITSSEVRQMALNIERAPPSSFTYHGEASEVVRFADEILS